MRPYCNDQSLTVVDGNNCRCFEYCEKCISGLHCVEKSGIVIVEPEHVITTEFYRINSFKHNFTRRERLSSSNSVQNFIINTNVKLFTA
jgi:hypothetical protein